MGLPPAERSQHAASQGVGVPARRHFSETWGGCDLGALWGQVAEGWLCRPHVLKSP